MRRGVEVAIGLRPGLEDENFVAEALGNLAGLELARRRGERLDWQVLRVATGNRHHFRLVVRHPDRILDVGFSRELHEILQSLSQESVESLRHRFARARADGLRAVPLRHLRETADYWRDDFWNWIG